MYLRAITAVLTAIALEPDLDAALVEILDAPMRFGDGVGISVGDPAD